jgi:GAF domain-containing protein
MQSLQLIRSAGGELDLELTLDGILSKVLEWAERIFDLEACAVLLHDEASDTLRIASSRGYRPEVVASFRARPGEGVTGQAFARAEPVLVADVNRFPSYVQGVRGATSEMAVPLMVQGRVIGVLDAEAATARPLTGENVELFGLFAVHVATAIRNAVLVERVQADAKRLDTRARDLAALNEASLRLATFTDLDSLLKGVMAIARRALPFRSCALLLVEGEDLVVRGVFGFDTGVGVGFRLPRGQGISWRCLEAGRPILVTDVAGDPDYVRGVDGCRCEMSAPLLGPGGPAGVFTAESPKPAAFDADSLALFSTFAHQVSVALENARLHQTNRDTFYQTIRALAHALEMRDSYTMGHSERVTGYARRIGRMMGLTDHDQGVVEQAGLLHDIGKIGVRDAVLLKPGRLTGAEREDIERHPIIGDSILHPVGFLREALEVVLHHHERFDGTGYPSGLTGEAIPLVARIISVADVYDAMTSRRPYRDPLPHADAVAQILGLSGTQFDPAVVAAFVVTVGREAPPAEGPG